MPENRICMLVQAEMYVKLVESFIEDMESEERARDNYPVYRTYNEEYVW